MADDAAVTVAHLPEGAPAAIAAEIGLAARALRSAMAHATTATRNDYAKAA